MKGINELYDCYRNQLLPDLKILEEERKKTLKKILTVTFAIIPIAILLAALAKRLIPYIIIITIIILAVVIKMFSKKYVKNFKVGIIDKIVKFIDDNLIYCRNKYIPRHLFETSKIFKQRVDKYRGDDYVEGKIGKTQVEFSEIHAQYVTRDSKGNRHHHTIFKGLFFVADFNKKFNGTTVVLPDVAEKLFGQIGTMLQSWNKSRGQLIKLESPEFEKYFAVYGDDQIQARYILSTSLMERIVNFKRKTGRKIYLSFVGSKIFVAISYRKNLFEPRIFKTLLEFTPIQEYYEDLATAIAIVQDLNLNTRIWSKQ